ncbi:leucine--tRNA ligase [bacterium]|nr:leucine--tRNA ligase [bacterium]
MEKYNHNKIEAKWQKKWLEEGLYKAGEDKKKEKFYILDMFPYPSGAGLHVGHPKGYIATDIFARMKTMQGYNVLHPMGWDAFGLPAENFAIKNKVHPRISTDENIATFKSQLRKLGFSYDWDREINTTDPKFYKWTQWIFLQLFKKGLAYESHEPINWCPSCKTGLANEDLEDGKCERCGSEIEQRPMRQWVLKITDYADRMLNDLEKLSDWDNSIKEMQKNWIGRSKGARVKFKIKNLKGGNEEIEVFTTRPDTLFGATYFVVSPEHGLIERNKSEIKNYKEVREYIEKAKKKTELERTDLAKEKTGVKIDGLVAINPVNKKEIPIFIADYVMMHYGTGAIMAVPAHDERDWEFAQKYNLPIQQVVTPNKKEREETIKALRCLKNLKKKADDKEINFWLLGGLAAAFYVGVIWRKHNDLDLIIKDNDKYDDFLKIIENEGYKKIKDKKTEDGFISSVYKNKDGVEIDIGPYLGISDLRDKDFEEDIKELEGVESHVLSCDFIKKIKDKQAKSRALKKDFLDKKYLDGYVFADNGIAVNSGFLDDLITFEAKKEMIKWLEENNLGKKDINYKLKDWVFSRQRYWGEPIPLIHCDNCGVVAVPEKDLPVELPEVEHYEPTGTGESPLASIEDWVNTTCPNCGELAKRETNTMPQWAGSSWYYLRFIDPSNDTALVDKQKEKYWSPVDFYVGGAEHATRHLIYARFWHKFLFDIGVVNYNEPFKRLQHVGIILAEDGRKMSKRWGNVINPDDIVDKYGADSMRVYEMFMGPFSQSTIWNTNGLVGARKFLDKILNLSLNIVTEKKDNQEIVSLLHKTIKKVGEDIEDFKLNTAVSSMMILVNKIAEQKEKSISKANFKLFLKILSPFTPHLAEELWEKLGNKNSIFKTKWPEYNSNLTKDKTAEFVVQVNGKLRDRLELPVEIDEKNAKEEVLKSEKIKDWLKNKEIVRFIFVPGKLINIVIKDA